MTRTTVFAALAALLPAGAFASSELTLSFALEDVTTVSYDCGQENPLSVVYVASETDTLALVPVDGTARVFADAVSGSGSRYVSGEHEWVTKGDTAMLRDTMKDETVLECGPVKH